MAEHELRVSHDTGARFRIDVRGHHVYVDQPRSTEDGSDSGPTPTELFVASVAACAAYYGHTYLARRGLPDQVDVAARWDYGKAPDRVTSIVLSVNAPGLPVDKAAVFRRVVGGCLVHNTLVTPPHVEVELQAGNELSRAG
jgi:uncharacterized OsmC-like protein